MRKPRSPEDKKRLEAFKKLLDIHGEPKIFTPSETPQPFTLQDVKFAPGLEEMLYETCSARFELGGSSMDSLASDMTEFSPFSPFKTD
jgi:hypothetical protein